jgi:uncharacterized membrane protein YecN with MAPEG domain
VGELQVPITAIYAALQALLAIGLVVPVGQLRAKTNVSLGAGGNPQLETAIRRHANWTEHVPIALLLMALLELNGASAGLLHGLGATLLVTLVAAIALLVKGALAPVSSRSVGHTSSREPGPGCFASTVRR